MVKVIWHKTASQPQTDGSIVFARWRQCAFPCGHISTTWRICLNLCFLRPTRVHNSNGKSIFLPFLHSSRQKVPMLYNGWSFPKKLLLLMGDLDPHLIHDSFGQSELTIQTASRSVQPFSHRWPQSVPILYNGPPLPPSNLPLPMGRSRLQSNTWFPGPTRILKPNGISIDSAIFAGLTYKYVTDRQTDWQTSLLAVLGRSQYGRFANNYYATPPVSYNCHFVIYCGFKGMGNMDRAGNVLVEEGPPWMGSHTAAIMLPPAP